MATCRNLIVQAAHELSGFPTPRLDAEVLLAHALGIARDALLARLNEEVLPPVADIFRTFLERRKRREPVAYISGEKEFWDLPLSVSPSVLIPRPETELLVEKALKFADALQGPVRLLDLGTGSGCISIAVAHELRKRRRLFQIVALDSSEAALAIARENVELHQLQDAVLLRQSDWRGAASALRPGFHVVMSNPPYVAEGDSQVSPETAFEPRSALYAGPEGLDAIASLVAEVPELLLEGGRFFCEIGSGQRAGVERLTRAASGGAPPRLTLVAVHRDLAGLDRVAEFALSE